MIEGSFIEGLNQIRIRFLDAVERLPAVPSFVSLCENARIVGQGFEEITCAIPDRLRQPFVGKFTSAIVGSSGHGKTTVVDELFPGLAKRGWLVTDVTDTTSQSLRIEYGSGDGLGEVAVHSWNLSQIKDLFRDPRVIEQNERDRIQVIYDEDAIRVEGSPESFSRKDFKNLKFGLKQTVRPFPHPYQVPGERVGDENFIRCLTVKEQSGKLNAGFALEVGGQHYNPLQLRVVVKDVTLVDGFENVARWTGLPVEDMARLTFIDTPGLAVSGSIKDEVLKHPLEIKSNQIVVDLLKNDELDIVIHLVLCGRQSDFATLWKALERECGSIGMDDLTERMVLAINGTNIMFSNRDIKRHMEKGEHFDVVLEDNILQKMSPRGRVNPARICFLDAKKIVESGLFTKYEKVYRENCTLMEGWLKPGSPAFRFLEKQNLVNAFRDNIAALADPEDRGQGHLLRQVVDLIKTKGHLLLIKKYLKRTGLLKHLDKLLEMLNRYYDRDGSLNSRAAEEAIRRCLDFLDEDDLFAIETFCRERIDSHIDAAVRGVLEVDDWVRAAFDATARMLEEAILHASPAGPEAAELFRRHFRTQILEWRERWGYEKAPLQRPTRSNDRTLILLAHSLRTHAREMLSRLAGGLAADGETAPPAQEEEDRETIAAVFRDLDSALETGRQLCRQYGVQP